MEFQQRNETIRLSLMDILEIKITVLKMKNSFYGSLVDSLTLLTLSSSTGQLPERSRDMFGEVREF